MDTLSVVIRIKEIMKKRAQANASKSVHSGTAEILKKDLLQELQLPLDQFDLLLNVLQQYGYITKLEGNVITFSDDIIFQRFRDYSHTMRRSG